jgi:hypothetical protein
MDFGDQAFPKSIPYWAACIQRVHRMGSTHANPFMLDALYNSKAISTLFCKLLGPFVCVYDHRICVYMCVSEFVQAIVVFFGLSTLGKGISVMTHHLHNTRKKEYGLLCILYVIYCIQKKGNFD